MNELMKNVNTDIMDIYKKSEDIVSDMKEIIDASQKQALQAVKISLVKETG